MPEWILEVSDLNEYVRAMLNADPALRSLRLRGEISNFKRHSSGHWYFTLKDDRCRISAVMFRQNAMRQSIRPMDGLSVIVSGQVSLYPESGTYQLYCENMRPDGVGTLYQQFEALKAKLAASGEFTDADRVIVDNLYEKLRNDDKVKRAVKTDDRHVYDRSIFPGIFDITAQLAYMESMDAYEQLFLDADKYKAIQRALADRLYRELHGE